MPFLNIVSHIIQSSPTFKVSTKGFSKKRSVLNKPQCMGILKGPFHPNRILSKLKYACFKSQKAGLEFAGSLVNILKSETIRLADGLFVIISIESPNFSGAI